VLKSSTGRERRAGTGKKIRLKSALLRNAPVYHDPISFALAYLFTDPSNDLALISKDFPPA
jgi:hypothetical protein